MKSVRKYLVSVVVVIVAFGMAVPSAMGFIAIDATFDTGAEPSDFGLAGGGNPGISGSGTGVWNQTMAAGETGYWMRTDGVPQAAAVGPVIHGGATITHTTIGDKGDQTVIYWESADETFTVYWGNGAMWLWGTGPHSWVVANTDGLEHSYEWELNLDTNMAKVFFDGTQMGSSPDGYDVSSAGGNYLYLGDATGGTAHSEVWNRWWIWEGDREHGEVFPGDVNGDLLVGGVDMTRIIGNWGQTGASRSDGDLNGDGTVGAADYNEVVSEWGTTYTLPSEPPEAPGAVPEPSTLLILMGGAIAGLIRRC